MRKALSPRRGHPGRAAGLVAALALALACSSPEGPGIGCIVSAVTVTPAGPFELEIGESRTLTATVNDNGGCSPAPVPTWSGASDKVSLSTTSGATTQITGLAVGSASISARAGGKESGTLAVSIVVPGPQSVAVNAGNDQTVTAGTAVPVKPSVKVLGKQGPLAGVVVTFSVTAGGGNATGTSVTTGADGVAEVGGWTLGATAGENRLVAQLAESAVSGNPVTFTATGTADLPASLTLVAGANQSGYAGFPVEVRPAVLVADQHGNPNAGVAVSFVVIGFGGAVTGADQVTGVDGIATVGSWTLGLAGENKLQITATGAGIAGNPTEVSATGIKINGVAAGGDHSCALGPPGGLYCWGDNLSGQLGSVGIATRPKPIAVAMSWAAAALGGGHTCAINLNAQLWCWGANQAGQLGDGTTQSRAQPMLTIAPAAAAAAGAEHTCWYNGTARQCAGRNTAGQLGNGTLTTPSGIISVVDPFASAKLAAGDHHTCALATGGTVYCWGGNERGAVGDGSGIDRTTPVAAGGFTYVDLAAGSQHSCAIRVSGGAGGPIDCWGLNARGQLGDGGTTNRLSPTPVNTSEEFVQITAGASHTCALSAKSQVYCWGANDFGQLGVGDLLDRLIPSPVPGSFQQVAAGDDHTCAVTQDARLVCWGRNLEGQLGDGTVVSSSSPVPVRF